MAADKNEWGSNLQFLLAMIGSAVGLGNIWRYPYVLYSSGGGAFFIPYIIAILLMGIPFLILEYSVGYNFKSSFAKGLRKINKKLEFLGWILPFATFVIMIYYSTIIGWIGIYVVLSFYKGWGNDPKQFFGGSVLKANSELSGMTEFVPLVAISMLISWSIFWLVSHKQLEKGLGKVSNILVPLLFIIMIIIVIYSLTLEGASIGLKELFSPKWSTLKSFDIWMAAFGQIIFSLSLGTSTAFTYAGYSGKETDLVTNAITIAFANCGFENFCALGVFSILGYMAKLQAKDISKVVDQGTGLVFVAYPTILNVLGNFAYVLGPAFFITVYLAGLTSILSMIEPLSFCIQNKFTWSRQKTMTVLSIIGAILSMMFATGYGGDLLGIIDTYINQVCVLLCIVFECFAYAWLFKAEKTIKTLNDRSKTLKVGKWWIIIVKYILPIFVSIVWVGGIIDIIKNGSIIQTVIFIIMTVILGALTCIFTFKHATNELWDEAENRL
ncbi:Na+-dependent transporter SNF family [Neocallimastix lanati (nom. inval.)]|nr:Na+-dependent transporter SNF family [Neocallimastix sp. JGI-2020a]